MLFLEGAGEHTADYHHRAAGCAAIVLGGMMLSLGTRVDYSGQEWREEMGKDLGRWGWAERAQTQLR